MFEHAVHLAITNPPADYVCKTCPDQYVGKLHQFETNAIDFPCRKLAQTFCSFGKKALLILESPHIREFVEPEGPAKGSTGSLIRRYLHEILKACENPDLGIFW